MMPFNAGGRRDSTPGHHCRSHSLLLTTPQWLVRACALDDTGSLQRRARHTARASNSRPLTTTHRQPDHHTHAPHASQNPLLSLTFPNSPARHHRAAVQSNEVYPTPQAPVRFANFGVASDKRFPLWISLHNSLKRSYKPRPRWAGRPIRRACQLNNRRAAADPAARSRASSISYSSVSSLPMAAKPSGTSADPLCGSPRSGGS